MLNRKYTEGVNRTDLALKIARIVDFCGKSSGLAGFQNTVDSGSAVIFDSDSGLCLSYVPILGPKRNLDHRSFFGLGRNVIEFIQIISFFERSSSTLGCETVVLELHYVIVIKHVAFFLLVARN